MGNVFVLARFERRPVASSRGPQTSAPSGALARDRELAATGARLLPPVTLIDCPRAASGLLAHASGRAALPRPPGAKVASAELALSLASTRASFQACFAFATGCVASRGVARFELISPACSTCR